MEMLQKYWDGTHVVNISVGFFIFSKLVHFLAKRKQ